MDDELRKAAEILNNDGVVVLPTETVYGIGTNSLSDKGLNKLYELKNRPVNKPISVLISNKEMINKVAKNITERQWKVISKFFPGPLTIVLDKQDYYGYSLTQDMQRAISISESTLYPVLRRLKNNGLLVFFNLR